MEPNNAGEIKAKINTSLAVAINPEVEDSEKINADSDLLGAVVDAIDLTTNDPWNNIISIKIPQDNQLFTYGMAVNFVPFTETADGKRNAVFVFSAGEKDPRTAGAVHFNSQTSEGGNKVMSIQTIGSELSDTQMQVGLSIFGQSMLARIEESN